MISWQNPNTVSNLSNLLIQNSVQGQRQNTPTSSGIIIQVTNSHANRSLKMEEGQNNGEEKTKEA